MKAVTKAIPLDYDRAPPRLMMKVTGWRAVVFWEAPEPEGVISIAREMFIAVLPITYFAAEPPRIEPGDPEVGEASTTWGYVQPLFGAYGQWPSEDVKFFGIVPPEDKRSKRALVEECSRWMDVASGAAQRRRRHIS
jgi:hypothetical protein